MSWPSSSLDSFFPSSGCLFSSSSLVLDSAPDASSCAAAVGEVGAAGVSVLPSGSSSLASVSLSSSSSFFDEGGSSPTGLLGAATTVDGSAVSSALNKT